MRYIFLGNLCEPYNVECDSVIDAVDWFYMDANGISIGFRPEYIIIRGVKIARMKVVTRDLNKGYVYAVPFKSLSRLKHLIK